MLNVTNSTDLTTVLGISFDPSSPAILLEYSIVNIVATSVIPVPVAGPLTAVAAALFGLVGGMAINVGTSVVGAWLGLLAVRHACRPCFMRMLGRYHEQWKALDAALTAQGYQVALLIRLAPVAPMVLTNILLSLTSLPLGTYLWTCAIGIVPANLPYAYAAELGISLSEEFPPKDPVMLTMTIIGFVASVGIAWKIGVIAKRLLRRSGALASRSRTDTVDSTPAEAALSLADEGADFPDAPSLATREAEAAAEAAAAEAAAEHATRAGREGGADGGGVELTGSRRQTRRFQSLRNEGGNLEDDDDPDL